MDLLFILIGIGLAAFVILVSYKSISRGIKAKLEAKENYLYYDNIINMVYKLGEEKKNAELVRRMAFKAHYAKREHD